MDDPGDQGREPAALGQGGVGRPVDDTAVLELLCKQLGIGPSDFEQYLQDEQKYYTSRRVEPPEVAAELDYVESLHRLRSLG